MGSPEHSSSLKSAVISSSSTALSEAISWGPNPALLHVGRDASPADVRPPKTRKDLLMMEFSGPAARHQTVAVKVGNVTVGGGAPVVVQSMTNTDTADVEATTQQVAALART